MTSGDPVLSPLAEPGFRQLFAARATALFGTGLSTVALALAAGDLDPAMRDPASATIAKAIPWIATGSAIVLSKGQRAAGSMAGLQTGRSKRLA